MRAKLRRRRELAGIALPYGRYATDSGWMDDSLPGHDPPNFQDPADE